MVNRKNGNSAPKHIVIDQRLFPDGEVMELAALVSGEFRLPLPLPPSVSGSLAVARGPEKVVLSGLNIVAMAGVGNVYVELLSASSDIADAEFEAYTDQVVEVDSRVDVTVVTVYGGAAV